jgi:alpha-1,3-rhamnosyl/mannosyltransferase
MPLILPKKAVTTIHDVAFVTKPDAYGFFEQWYQRFAVRFAGKHADCVLTVSEFSKLEIVRYFHVAAEKIAVTPLGFDPTQFHPQQEIRRSPVPLVPGTAYFLFVGRIEWKKNIAGLLAGFRLYKEKNPASNVALVLVGKRGYGGDEAVCTIDGWAGKDSVHELGYVSQVDLPSVYAGAEAFVFPSWYEGFGIPVLEAMASGIPVITAKAASLPEVAGDAALYVDPADSFSIATAIGRIRTDAVLRSQLITKGLERCRQFSWKQTAEKTWKAIEEIL